MKKLLIFGLLVLIVMVVSCAPSPGADSDEAATEKLFQSGSVAGQAIATLGCKTSAVQKCTDQRATIQYSNGRKLVTISKNSCSGSSTALSYSCLTENQLQRCSTTCKAGELCQRGRCVVVCGNGRVDLGETCSSCPADVQCAAGQVCKNSQCVVPCVPVAATACTAGVGCPRNTVVPALGCHAGQVCEENVCVEERCDNEINVEENFNQSLTINYCTHLRNNNNMKIYFSYDAGKLIVYTVKNIKRTDYLLDSTSFSSEFIEPYFAPINYKYFDSYPINYIPINIYSNGERIEINYFDQSKVNIVLVNNCAEDRPYCNLFLGNLNSYFLIESDLFKSYYNNSLFSSEELKNNFAAVESLANNRSVDFLKQNLGIFPPVDKIVQFNSYEPEGGGWSASTGFWVINHFHNQISEQDVENNRNGTNRYGNTHEFVHIFFYGTPIQRSWFEEGLANYMQDAALATLPPPISPYLSCHESGWESVAREGGWSYVNVHNYTVVPYSNFLVPPQGGADVYDPLNPTAYYFSAQCFWVYINETYGSEAIKNIAKAWDNTRKKLPPKEKWLIKDITNPTLNVNLSPLVESRYNYVEE